MLDLEDWPDLNRLHPPRKTTVVPRPRVRTNSLRISPAPPIRLFSSSLAVSANAYTRCGLKRWRPGDDDDDIDSPVPPTKRRRLRHLLTTSRLSSDYATPPTHVPARKSLRQGIWARQRVSGRDLLRKAALFNNMSKKKKGNKRTDSRATLPPHHVKSNMIPYEHVEICSASSPKLSTFSDYEIFDFEDDSSQDEDDDSEPPSAIHSDFNKIQEPIVDNGISLEGYSFDGPSSLGSDDLDTFDPGGKVLSIILENEKGSEVSHASRIV